MTIENLPTNKEWIEGLQIRYVRRNELAKSTNGRLVIMYEDFLLDRTLIVGWDGGLQLNRDAKRLLEKWWAEAGELRQATEIGALPPLPALLNKYTNSGHVLNAVAAYQTWLETAVLITREVPNAHVGHLSSKLRIDAATTASSPPDNKRISVINAMSNVVSKAYAQFCMARDNADISTDLQAYIFLKESEEVEDKLPCFETWSRNLRTARKLLGEQKNCPRKAPGQKWRNNRPVSDESG